MQQVTQVTHVAAGGTCGTSANLEHLPRALAVAGSDDGRVHVVEAVLLEELPSAARDVTSGRSASSQLSLTLCVAYDMAWRMRTTAPLVFERGRTWAISRRNSKEWRFLERG